MESTLTFARSLTPEAYKSTWGYELTLDPSFTKTWKRVDLSTIKPLLDSQIPADKPLPNAIKKIDPKYYDLIFYKTPDNFVPTSNDPVDLIILSISNGAIDLTKLPIYDHAASNVAAEAKKLIPSNLLPTKQAKITTGTYVKEIPVLEFKLSQLRILMHFIPFKEQTIIITCSLHADEFLNTKMDECSNLVKSIKLPELNEAPTNNE